ncbi:hypothetical protein D3C76_828460 [compost metagenome]
MTLGGLRHGVPEIVQRLARAGLATLQHTVGQHGGIHRAGTGCAHPFNGKPAILEQPIEHAPSERTMHPAALQSQRDRLTFVTAPTLSVLHAHSWSPRRC